MSLEKLPQLLIQTFFGAVILKFVGLTAAIVNSIILVGEGYPERWAMAFGTTFVLLALLVPLVFQYEQLTVTMSQRLLKLALGFAVFAPFLELIQSSWAPIDMGIVTGLGWIPEQVHNIHALGLLFIIAPIVLASWQYGRIGFFLTQASAGFLYMLLPLLIPAGTFTLVLYFVRGFVLLGVTLIMGLTIEALASAQRREQVALEEANQKLAEQAVMIEQLAVSRERNRLARELHDTLAHSLSATAVQLQAVQTLMGIDLSSAKQELTLAQKQIKEGLQESRRAIQALRATPLDDSGFVLALKQRASTIGERAGLQVQWQVDGTWPNLPSATEQSLYRILDEAFANIEKHAQAKTLAISLETHPTMIQITLQDDGVGFELEAVRHNGRFGLIGMKERATLIGATLIIDAVPEQGTRIELCLTHSFGF